MQVVGAMAAMLPEQVWALLPLRVASVLRTATRAYRGHAFFPLVAWKSTALLDCSF